MGMVPNKILFPIIIYVEVGEQLWISLYAFLMFHSFAVFSVILAAHSSQLVAPTTFSWPLTSFSFKECCNLSVLPQSPKDFNSFGEKQF
jgi:hypothetical protein